MSRPRLDVLKLIGEMTFIVPGESESSGIFEGKFRGTFKIKVRTVEDEKVKKIDVEKFVKLNSHPNVQRLYTYEFYDSIHHFGLQSCDLNLHEFIQMSKNKRIKMDLISMIRDITEGLKFLHDNEIIHENLNFKNIGINKTTKRAVLCYSGFDDLQEDLNIFISPEEVPGENPSFKTDIFNLGCIIYFILSNGSHPFGSLNNPVAIKDNIKTNQFDREYKDFKNLISGKAVKSNFKIECAISMLKMIFRKDPVYRPYCSEILEHPFFWSNLEIYSFIKKISKDWELLIESDRNLINDKGQKFFIMHTWTYQLKNQLKGTEYNLEERKSLLELVKFVGSKVIHYEEETNNSILSSEHLLYYLEQFPYLLPLVFSVNKEILKKNNKQTKAVNFVDESSIIIDANHSFNISGQSELNESKGNPGTSSMCLEENLTLKNLFVEHNLPTDLLKSSNAVVIGDLIDKSIAEVYSGKFQNKFVAIKKIKKSEFKINELISINKLLAKQKSNKKEKNENIIKFFGCYEERKCYCIIMEKAEMDFRAFVEKYQNEMNLDDKITDILFDAVNGLEYMHKSDVTHLDIKPENILIVNRNNKLIGCLADFGESFEGIKKTYKKSKVPGTRGYIAPELIKVAKQREANERKRRLSLDIKKTSKDASLKFSKCDIYSLGMVIIQDCLDLSITDKPLQRSLTSLRRKGKISFACEELANFMTEHEPTKRPDAESVRKNPFFWKDPEKKISFLKAINKHRNRHETDQQKIKKIESDAVKKLHPFNSWMEFFGEHKEVQLEINKYLEDKNKNSNSIFDFVELILILVNPKIFKEHFLHTRQILINASDLSTFLNFIFSKLDVITYLYYVMLDELKFLWREFYSSDTPKRLITRRITVDERPSRKRKLSTVSDTASEMSFSGPFKVPKVPKLFKS